MDNHAKPRSVWKDWAFGLIAMLAVFAVIAAFILSVYLWPLQAVGVALLLIAALLVFLFANARAVMR
jgi:hypothetical protein